MLNLHLPRNFEQVGKSIKNTDPAAWVVLAVAIASLAVLLVVVSFR